MKTPPYDDTPEDFAVAIAGAGPEEIADPEFAPVPEREVDHAIPWWRAGCVGMVVAAGIGSALGTLIFAGCAVILAALAQ